MVGITAEAGYSKNCYLRLSCTALPVSLLTSRLDDIAQIRALRLQTVPGGDEPGKGSPSTVLAVGDD